MSLSVQCGQCGKSLKIAPQFCNDSVTCPACGHVFLPQAAVDPTDDEVIEVGEADIVESDDVVNEPLAVNVQRHDVAYEAAFEPAPASLPLASTGDPECRQSKALSAPLLAALAGAGAALLLVAIAGLGWWAISHWGSQPGAEAMADRGTIESTEMPWDVADANRHRRHNKEPIERASTKASQPTEKPIANTVQTFQRQPTEAEVRARIKTRKDLSTASTPTPATTTKQDRARVIEEIKSATVFIRVETSEGIQSGSGFLFQRYNNWGTIVTNAHVIEPEEGKLKEIKCIFFSGTNREFEVTAKVSCKDQHSDLAFLKAYSEKIPAPISTAKDAEIYETSTVLAAGFPFGEVLKTNRRNPSITITKGTVSSLRRDDYDSISMLQIDGGINPGNSGGPVVLEDGRLVGVAVAKVFGTSIGFAIPTQILQQTILGRMTRVTIQKTDQERRRHQFKIRFADPNRLVKSGDLVVFRSSDQTVHHPESDGSWLPAAERLLASKPLRVGVLGLTGQTNAVAVLEIPDAVNLMFQVRIGRRGGGEHWSPPTALPDSLELNVATVVPLSGAREEPETIDKQRSKHTIAVLPAMMGDFAFDPTTGNIACLDPTKHEAHLIRTEDLESADFSSSPKVNVGKGPVSVAYKRYQENEYFVVACDQESDIYLLTADSLELVNRIKVAGSHVSRVLASTNREDPFVYYGYGDADDSPIGAIDLRAMTDCGKVLDEAIDCTVAADGRFLYRRRSKSSVGIGSLRMISKFSAPAPTFAEHSGDRRAAGECVPGPFGEITALGPRIYSAGLDKHLETMDFTPICFFRSRPVIIGLSMSQRQSQRKLILRAASLNTFTSATSSFQLPSELVHLSTARQQTVPRPPEASSVFVGASVFADDLNQQVVYASRDKVALIPLDLFELREDEPLMRLTSTSADLQVGQKQKVELRTANPAVSIEVGEMPSGMKQIVSGLSWRPEDEHVGTTTIPIMLTFDDIERVVDFRVHVRQPSLRTSIEVADFVVDPNLAFYVCWSRPEDNASRRSKRAGNVVGDGSTLCVIPLDEESEPISAELSYVIQQATLLGNRIAVLPAGEDQQVYILDLNTLEREKLLLSSFPVKTIDVQGDELLLLGDKHVDVYSVESLKRLRNRDGRRPSSQSAEFSQRMLVDGELIDGVLYGGSDSQPMLVVAPGDVPTLPSGQASLMDGRFLRRIFTPTDSSAKRDGSNPSKLIVAGPVAIPEAKLQVLLENRINDVQVPGVDLQQAEQQVTLLLAGQDGSVTARVPVCRETLIAGDSPLRPVMRVAGGEVMVGCGSRIYRWNPSSIRRDTQDKSPTGDDSRQDELHFVPRQSVFIVTDATTSLSHAVAGGSPPYDLSLMTRLGGVELNGETGEVILSRDSLILEAATLLAAIVEEANAGGASQALKSRSLELSKTFERLTGRSLTGFPIAVPIHLKVSDREGAVAGIQYFVFVDLPLDDAVAAIPSGK